MTYSRRHMLAVVGGGTILAAGAGFSAFLTTRTPARALAPWDAAGEYGEPRRNALSYALLAPNPHNRQPWMVDLATPDTVHVFRDGSKDLPETDPFSRQLTIGMGCFLELMAVAASRTGHRVDLDLFPEGETGPVATARFVPDAAEPDPLSDAIGLRRSCKEPFAARPVEPGEAVRLAPFADIVTDPSRVAQIVDLTWEAWNVETRTPRTMRESVDLMRIGRAEIEANPDGIDLGGPFLGTLAAIGMLSREGQMDRDSFQFAEGVRLYDEMLHATPAYAVMHTATNAREDQIETGRRWLRLNLTTAALGLALHPVSQALQEYPEMAEHRTRAHALLAPDGRTLQMLGRLGYGPPTPRSPRWPLEAKIVRA